MFKFANKKPDYSVYYFLHIPKTAGTSFSQYLRQQYHNRDTITQETWNMLYAYHQHNGKDQTLAEYINNYRLLTGHYSWLLHRYLENPVQTITILRNPYDRTVSQLCHIKSEPLLNNWVRPMFIASQENISHVVEDSWRMKFFTNYQARYLTASFDYIKLVSKSSFHGADLMFDSCIKFQDFKQGNDLLNDAKNNLNRCYFVGVQDYVDESMIYLSYLSGWKPPAKAKRLTKASTNSQTKYLKQRHKDIIRQAVETDQIVYEFAKQEFESKYLRLINKSLQIDIDWQDFIKNRENINQRLRDELNKS